MKPSRVRRHGALVFVDLAAVAELCDQDDVGRVDAVDHAVVADAEAAGASEAVAQGLAELEGVGGELLFDGAADLALDRLVVYMMFYFIARLAKPTAIR